MRRVVIAGIISTATVVAAALAAQPESVEIKFDYRPGTVSRQKTVSRSVGAFKMPDPIPEQKFSQTFEQTVVSKCRKVNPDGSAVMDMSMQDVAMKMTMGGMNIDSTAPETPNDPMKGLMTRLFSAMAKLKFTMTVSDNGHVQKVEGLSEAFKKAMDEASTGSSFPGAKLILDQLVKAFDDQKGEEMQRAGRMLPDHKGPIKIGEKWERTWKMKVPFLGSSMEGKGEYELVGIEEFRGRRCAKISTKESFRMTSHDSESQPAAEADKEQPSSVGSSQATRPASKPAGLLDSVDLDLSTSGGEGIAYIDCATGQLVQSRQTQTMNLAIRVKGDPKATDENVRQGLPRMEQRIRNSVSMDLLDDAPASNATPTAAKQ